MTKDNEYTTEIMKRALLEIKTLKSKLKSNDSIDDPIAVIGIGCSFPGGINNPKSFWETLIEQNDMLSDVSTSRWKDYALENSENNYIKKAGFLKEDINKFDYRLFRFSPKEAERTDPQHRLFLKVVWRALEDAGYPKGSLKNSQVGIYSGITHCDYINELYMDRKARNIVEAGDVVGSSFSFLSGRASYFFGFQGPSITVDTACSSSLVSIDQACKGLITGDCDMAIAGGVNIMYSPETTDLFAVLNILSPTCEIKPFDANANGTVRGEGCGVVVLKRLSDAKKSKDNIYAIIKGSSVNQDGPSSGPTAPYGPSQENLIKHTLKKSNLISDDIDYIETHGTGTELGDPIEISALENVFSKNRKRPLYVGAVKGNIGHLEAAAGVAGLIKTILMVKNGKIPGNLNFNIPSKYIDWKDGVIRVPTKTISWKNELGKLRTAGVSSFGLSGTNAHVIVEEYLNEENETIKELSEYEKDNKWPFKFTSNTEKGIVNQLEAFLEYLNENKFYKDDIMPHLAYSQNKSKADLNEKMVIWADSIEKLRSNIKLVLSNKSDLNINFKEKEKKVIFLFTGQGSQYSGMFKELYYSNDIFKYWMDKCNKLYEKCAGDNLLEIIFSKKSLLDETRYTQPALFAVEYSLAKMWIEYGIEASYMIGHSIGEYVAACLSEVFTLEEAINLVVARGRYMYELKNHGKMVAISMKRDEVKGILANSKNVSIAATNSQEQTIISGDSKEIDEICKRLKSKSIKTKNLNVSHAFHSQLMEPMIDKFESVSKKIIYKNPCNKIISNVTANLIEDDIACWQYWSKHVLSEVKFYESIKSIKNIDDYVFLEIGPAPILTSFIETICENEVDCIASNSSNIKIMSQLERTLFKLYLKGSNIQWKQYYDNRGLKRIEVPNYRFNEKILKLPKLDINDLNYKYSDSGDSLNLNEEYKEESCFKFNRNLSVFKNINEAQVYVRKEIKRELKIDEEELKNDENLLLYGLNSIITTKFVALWKNNLGLSVSPSILLKDCTINKWGKILYEKSNDAIIDIKEKSLFKCYPEKKYDSFLLNKVQNAYWVGRNSEMAWGGVSCYASYEIDMDNLDIEKFKKAVELLVERHDMLRCVIDSNGNQKILPKINIPLKVYKKTEINNLGIDIKKDIAIQVLPLEKPMFDIRIIEINETKWKIYFGIDFMIADALSVSIFWRDLACFYFNKELPELKVTYKDYLTYENINMRSNKYEQDKKYWLNKIESFPNAPDLPVNISKEKVAKFVRRKKWLNSEIWNKFVKSAAKYKLTPSSALLCLYSEVLSAWGGGNEFAVMLTVFNREQVHEQINQVIGDFTQLALVKIKRVNTSIGENAINMQLQMQNDIEHSNYSAIDFLKELKKKDDRKEAIYPIVFTSAIGMENLSDNENTNKFNSKMENIASSTPQVWLDHQVISEKDGVSLNWDSLDDIFYPNVIQSMFEKYVELVIRASKEEKFWESILLDLRSENEKHSQNEANGTFKEMERLLLHEGLLRKAFVDENRCAIIFNDEEYSYRQLINRSNQVSAFLQSQGVKKGEKVGVQMCKSFEQIAVVIGILQIGAVYIPMSYDQPSSRTWSIINKSEMVALFLDDKKGIFEPKIKEITPGNLNGNKGVWSKVEINPLDLAYIIYTSGSTGTPKGVCIQHSSAMNTIQDVNDRFNVTLKDRVLGISSLSFDLSVYDIFGMVSVGGTLVLPTEEERIDPKSWKRLTEKYDVTLWNSVPALMEIYADYIINNKDKGKDYGIKQIILSGDWIPLGLLNKLKIALPNANLISMGGATEASIWSNYYEVSKIEDSWKSIPYGYPLSNQSFYILDEFNRPCPNWVKGKLFIGGKGIADGYLNEKELTEKAFVYDRTLNMTIYNTGDYGRYMEDGAIEFLGRKDNQLKINGYRIEIGEIEAAFKKAGVTEEVIIIPIGTELNKKKIVSYIKCKSTSFLEKEIKMLLKTYLPEYFIPERIIRVDEFPITQNGKIDRKKLLTIFEEQQKNEYENEEINNFENNPVLEIVQKTLNILKIDPKNSFSDIGVSSVDIIRLANNLETEYSIRPSVGELISYKSINELLNFYEDKLEKNKDNNKNDLIENKFSLFTSDQIDYLNNCKFDTSNSVKKDSIMCDFSNEAIEEKQFKEVLDSYYIKARTFINNAKDSLTIENYPIKMYLTIFKDKVNGIERGKYYFDLESKLLLKISEDETSSDYINHNKAFTIHFLCDLNNIYPVYGSDSLKEAFIETGMICHALESRAKDYNIHCIKVSSYDFNKERTSFGLDIKDYYLQSIICGKVNNNYRKGNKECSNLSLNEFVEMVSLAKQCKDNGISLWLENDKLKFKAAKGSMSSKIRNELKLKKESLIKYFYIINNPDSKYNLMKKENTFKLTPIQLAYLLGRSKDYELGNVSAHYYSEYKCDYIDYSKFEKAINEVIIKNEMLRTIIYENGTQEVLNFMPKYDLEINKVSNESDIKNIRNIWSHHFYELGKWPMFNIQISELKTNKVIIHFSFDCLISDGLSTKMLFKEIFKAYYGKKIESPKFTLREYVKQQDDWIKNSKYHSEAEKYWEEKIKYLPLAPKLPVKMEYNLIKKPHFDRRMIILSQSESKILKDNVKKYKFTTSAVICTAYMKILSRWSKEKDLTLNLTLFNRLPMHRDVMKIIGDFTNITLIPYIYDKNNTFLAEVEVIQKLLWDAIEYRTYNGLNLLKKLSKKSPGKAIMPIVFTSLLFGEYLDENENLLEDLEEVYSISQTPQVALDHQVYESNGNIVLIWDFASEVFEKSLIDNMFCEYVDFIKRLISEKDWNKILTITMDKKE